MEIDSVLTEAVLRTAIAGGLAGIMGGLLGSIRSSVFVSVLFGAIGGISMAAIIRIGNIDPFAENTLFDAGLGFSYVWAAIGGFFLGYVTTRSSGR